MVPRAMAEGLTGGRSTRKKMESVFQLFGNGNDEEILHKPELIWTNFVTLCAPFDVKGDPYSVET